MYGGPSKRAKITPEGGSLGLSLTPAARARRRVMPYKRKTVRRAAASARFGYALPSASLRIMNAKGGSGGLRTCDNSTLVQLTGAGAGTGYPILFNLSTAQIPNFATYSPLFTKLKVNSIKFIFELTTIEQSDDALIPIVYCRYNHDPDLTTTPLNGTYFGGVKNAVKKALTSTDNRLEYTIYPQVMTGGAQATTGQYMPMPRKSSWIDATQDITQYGFMAYVSPFGTNEVINVFAEWDVSWAEPK